MLLSREVGPDRYGGRRSRGFLKVTGPFQHARVRQAALRRSAGFYGLLNFVRQTVKMSVQPVVQLALDLVDCEVPDQRSVSRILAKFFD